MKLKKEIKTDIFTEEEKREILLKFKWTITEDIDYEANKIPLNSEQINELIFNEEKELK